MKPAKRDHELIKRIALGSGYAEQAPISDREAQMARDMQPAYEWMSDNEKAVQLKCRVGQDLNLANPISLRSPIIRRNQVPVDLSNLYSLYVYDKEIDFFDESQHRKAFAFKANVEDAHRRKAVVGRDMLSRLQSNSKESVRSRRKLKGKIFERMVTHTKVDRMFEEFIDDGRYLDRSLEEGIQVVEGLSKCKQKEEWKPVVSIGDGIEESEATIKQRQMNERLQSFMTDCNEVSRVFNPTKKEVRSNSSNILQEKSTQCVKQIIRETKTLLPRIHRQLKKEKSNAEGSLTIGLSDEENSPRPDLSSIFKTNDRLASFQLSSGGTPKQELTENEHGNDSPRAELSNSGENTLFLPTEVQPSVAVARRESSLPLGSSSFVDSTPLPELDTDAIIITDIRQHFFENILAGNPELNEGYSRPFMINMVTDKPRVYVKLPAFSDVKEPINLATNIVGKVKQRLASLDQHFETETSKNKSILRSKEDSSFVGSKARDRSSRVHRDSFKDSPGKDKLTRVMKKVDFNGRRDSNFGRDPLHEDTQITFGISERSRVSRLFDNATLDNSMGSIHQDSKLDRRDPPKKKSIIAENQIRLDKVKKNLAKLAKMKAVSEQLREKQNNDFMTSIKSYRRDQAYFKQSQLESLHTVSLNNRYSALRTNARQKSENQRIRQFMSPESKVSKQVYCRMVEIYKKYSTNIRVVHKALFEYILTYHKLIIFEGGHLGRTDFKNLVDFTNRWPDLNDLNSSEMTALGNFIRSYGAILNYTEIKNHDSSILNSMSVVKQ